MESILGILLFNIVFQHNNLLLKKMKIARFDFYNNNEKTRVKCYVP